MGAPLVSTTRLIGAVLLVSVARIAVVPLILPHTLGLLLVVASLAISVYIIIKQPNLSPIFIDLCIHICAVVTVMHVRVSWFVHFQVLKTRFQSSWYVVSFQCLKDKNGNWCV